MLIEVRVPFAGSQFQSVNRASEAITEATGLLPCEPERRRVFGPQFQEDGNGLVLGIAYRVSDREMPRDAVWLKKADKVLARGGVNWRA